jgi:hypothetical protein
VVGRDLVDAVAETDVLRALAGGSQERFRRRRVGVLLEEVMLDFPRVVVAELVGQLHLAQRVLIELVFVALFPGPRQLQLVENAKLHTRLLPLTNLGLTAFYCAKFFRPYAAAPQYHALLP